MRCLPLASSVLLLLVACTTPNTPATSGTVSFTMDDPLATQVQEFANDTWTTLTLHLELGTQPKSVYLAFTNRATSPTTSVPTVSSNERAMDQGTEDQALPAVGTDVTQVNDLAFATRLPRVATSLRATGASRGLAREVSTTPATSTHAVGDTGQVFRYSNYDEQLITNHTFTLAAQVSNDAQNRIVNVWVDSSLYSATTSTPGKTVTSSMAAALGSKFLQAHKKGDSGTGTGADIYSWATGIFGREYAEPGTEVDGSLVSPTGEINLVLADLNPNRAHQSSFVYGYFWAVNNFRSFTSLEQYPGVEASNASISFYLDAPLFSTLGANETTWTIDADNPAEMVSTLAHEFQHMIQFYQKQLLRGLGDTDTWINEMCSLVAEDLVASQLMVPGPRGIPLAAGAFDFSTGSLAANGRTSRLAVFNRYYPTRSLTSTSNYAVEDYAMAYSFGSWLARNYGGATLFGTLVRNNGTDVNAVVAAVNEVNGTSITWAQLLRQWAAAVVGSTDALPTPRALQKAAPFSFTATVASAVNGDQLNFPLGSIDYTKFYAYQASASESLSAGPILSSRFSLLSALPPSGLYLLKPYSSATGGHTLTITLPATVDVTVVTKVAP